MSKVAISATLSEISSEPVYPRSRPYDQPTLDYRIEDLPIQWFASFRVAGNQYGHLRIALPSKEDAQALTVGSKYTITLTENKPDSSETPNI